MPKINPTINPNTTELASLSIAAPKNPTDKMIAMTNENHENPIIEVPLSAKAHMEYLFKKIIFVDANKSIREKRIAASRPYDAKKAIELYDKNNPKTLQNSIIFKNNFTNLKELKNEIATNLINKV